MINIFKALLQKSSRDVLKIDAVKAWEKYFKNMRFFNKVPGKQKEVSPGAC